jgi:uncharacterized protein YjiS (DUF1127 family)
VRERQLLAHLNDRGLRDIGLDRTTLRRDAAAAFRRWR